MATVAEQLKKAREAHGLTIQQVADATKMRADHVRALESGDYDVFVAPVYIRGFVRSYARLVKIDAAEIMQTLEKELAQTEKFREPPSLSAPERTFIDFVMLHLSRVNWRIALPLIVAAAVLGGVFWIQHAVRSQLEQDPTRGIEPGLYRPVRTPPGNTLPLPPPSRAPAPR
ncbi:MAG TPA: helix-turn-helix domain-containing protein [Verrucomicrobiota bacterium]|nr:helix-turn-helix domain-containing protein [Verrucomicrobiota bacterium]